MKIYQKISLNIKTKHSFQYDGQYAFLKGSNGIEIYEKCRTKMARQAGLEPAAPHSGIY